MDAQQIVDAVTNNPAQLTRLGQAIAGNNVSVQALGQAISVDGVSPDTIVQAINNGTVNALGRAIATDNDASQAIVQAGVAAAGGLAGLGAPPVAGDDSPCGTLPTAGRDYAVRPGRCFPDNEVCRGSILKNPSDASVPITTEEIFRRDSLFVNFENTRPRNLDEIIDVTHGSFLIQDNDRNVFNYRNFFFVDPRDDNLVNYNRNPLINPNIVRLRYDVGLSYPRESDNLSIPSTNPTENAEIEAGKKLVSTFSRNKYWTICPEFFTYRMLPLKRGYMSAYGYGKINMGKRSMPKCIGVHVPGDDSRVNDVYVYTFVDSNGTLVSNATEINKKKRLAENSFQGGDLPYEDGFFIFPKDSNGNTIDTVVCARYPDGILLFSYQGRLTPVPPFGTIVNVDKLHRTANQRPGYPDQVAHEAITVQLARAMDSLLNTNGGTFNARTIHINERDRRLDTVPNLQNVIAGGVGYIAMMSAIKELVRTAKVPRDFGGSRSRRRFYNKSIKQKRNKTKSKSKGRGRARAASMLKSAKQRFYRSRTGGGGMGINLGLGSSGPQPLQCNSPLVSQASPV